MGVNDGEKRIPTKKVFFKYLLDMQDPGYYGWNLIAGRRRFWFVHKLLSFISCRDRKYPASDQRIQPLSSSAS